MPLLLLNVGLLVSATFAAIFAIRGGTTRSNAEPRLLRRLTPRGWVSLGCIRLTFLLGVSKEVIVQSSATRQIKENAELKGQIRSQLKHIENLRTEVKTANDTLSDTRDRLVEVQTASRRTTEAIQAFVYDRLSLHTVRFLDVVSNMLEEASDGWLPATEREFVTVQALAGAKRGA